MNLCEELPVILICKTRSFNTKSISLTPLIDPKLAVLQQQNQRRGTWKSHFVSQDNNKRKHMRTYICKNINARGVILYVLNDFFTLGSLKNPS